MNYSLTGGKRRRNRTSKRTLKRKSKPIKSKRRVKRTASTRKRKVKRRR
tara:strand:- start:57 stop:203 length:147 start_codon:yes stop_codon:yes gene_type:complete